MKAIELVGDVDAQRRLHARVPQGFPQGPVRVLLLVPEEDDAGESWMEGVAQGWADELSDLRQDIYTLEDGRPPNAAR